ncbi:MAG: hypothetical protein AAFU53_12020 [Cyanobacteria bacterium J06632_3]
MTHPATIFPISALAVSAILLLTGCDSRSVATNVETDEYGYPIADVTSQATASPVSATSSSDSVTAGSITPPDGLADGQSASTGELTHSTGRDFAVELLSRDAIARIAASLDPDHTLITDQSFSFELSNDLSDESASRETTESETVSLVASNAEENTAFLALTLVDADGNSHLLPPHADGWWFQEVKAVSFDELNGDSQGPDIIVIADYITGIGPTGSEPFSVAKAYFYEGDYRYRTDERLNELLAEKEVQTIAEAKDILSNQR